VTRYLCSRNSFLASGEAPLAASLITSPIKYRFIGSLLTLIKKFGIEKPDHLFIPIRRDEIGSYINVSKASLSRVVTALEKKQNYFNSASRN
tara:strand:+ start:472 stop:747 length:276 start_codon:yes stop_codon:yes gene_type:complete